MHASAVADKHTPFLYLCEVYRRTEVFIRTGRYDDIQAGNAPGELEHFRYGRDHGMESFCGVHDAKHIYKVTSKLVKQFDLSSHMP